MKRQRERERDRDREREKQRERETKRDKIWTDSKSVCRSDTTTHDAIEYDMIVSYSILQNAV